MLGHERADHTGLRKTKRVHIRALSLYTQNDINVYGSLCLYLAQRSLFHPMWNSYSHLTHQHCIKLFVCN